MRLKAFSTACRSLVIVPKRRISPLGPGKGGAAPLSGVAAIDRPTDSPPALYPSPVRRTQGCRRVEADGGTLFLDEVDSLSLAAQVKLLRFLQEWEYRPLGSSKACKADVRIMAASNGELETCVQAGKLRTDLYYRLNVLRLHLPPLRQRQQDIPLLARHFLVKFVARCSPSACDFAPCALASLGLGFTITGRSSTDCSRS
jgi:hypothetical protein